SKYVVRRSLSDELHKSNPIDIENEEESSNNNNNIGNDLSPEHSLDEKTIGWHDTITDSTETCIESLEMENEAYVDALLEARIEMEEKRMKKKRAKKRRMARKMELKLMKWLQTSFKEDIPVFKEVIISSPCIFILLNVRYQQMYIIF